MVRSARSGEEKVTVLGARGFVGSNLVNRLRVRGLECEGLTREDDVLGRDLGRVVYCIGVGSDFRSRVLDTVDAHVCQLERILRRCRFDSFTYLSSTAVYDAGSAGREEDPIAVDPASAGDLYAISKLMGEALVLSVSGGRVARLSTVYGPDFRSSGLLPSVLRDVVTTNAVTFRTSLSSARDFVSVDDVADCLVDIATRGRHRLYNVAGGRRVSHRELAARLVELTGCRVEVAADASDLSYSSIAIERLRSEFGYRPARLLDDLPHLLQAYGRRLRGAASSPAPSPAASGQ